VLEEQLRSLFPEEAIPMLENTISRLSLKQCISQESPPLEFVMSTGESLPYLFDPEF
jgi:hypothetical protein